MADRKINDEQKAEIVSLRQAGVPYKEIAAKLGISVGLACKYAKKLLPSDTDFKPAPGDSATITEFTKRVRSILWRENSGADKKSYNSWTARVAELESPGGGEMTHSQAVVRASKEFACLHRLFREYDLSDFDPNPDSHPTIKHFGKPLADAQVVSEGIEQSYRDSLRWAIDAAGMHLRTGDHPETCPCDAAFYLYRQAIESPKDFMAKVGQIEMKVDAESAAAKSARKSGNRSVQELDAMLQELEGDTE